MASLTWPAVVTIAVVASMITVLVVSGHATAVTLASTALGSVALALAHAFIANSERKRMSQRLNETQSQYDKKP